VRLQGARVPPSLAALVAIIGGIAAIAAVLTLITAAVLNEIDDIEPTISAAVDDLEDWLVEDSPFDISRSDIDDFREDAGENIGRSLRESSGAVVDGALVAVEVLLAIVIGLIVAFFALKDGDRFLAWVRHVVPAARTDTAARMASRAWSTLGGYLRGAAVLGIVEGTILGTTLWLVGGELAVPMGVLAAFVPFVGAIVAGACTVLVALATAGFTEAMIVLVVAFVVQQLDNDILAPVVYGRALNLHPVLVLLAIVAGGALFGVPGSLLAIPVTAVAWNVASEARSDPA
jgi:putative heme transporter